MLFFISLQVITVAIGNEADKRALVDVTPNKVNAINATTKEQPSHVGEEIIKRVNQGLKKTLNCSPVAYDLHSPYLHVLSFHSITPACLGDSVILP